MDGEEIITLTVPRFLTLTTTPTSSSDDVWRDWVDARSTAVTATVNAWTTWNDDWSITAIGTSSAAATDWKIWNHVFRIKEPEYLRSRRIHLLQPTAEELEQRRRAREEAERAHAKAKAARQTADARAEKLLRSCLTREQLRSLEERGHFHVTGADGNVYKIKRGTHGNVEKVDPTSLDRALERFCVQPDNVPTADAMLAQKLALECNPQAFFSVANRTVIVRA